MVTKTTLDAPDRTRLIAVNICGVTGPLVPRSMITTAPSLPAAFNCWASCMPWSQKPTDHCLDVDTRDVGAQVRLGVEHDGVADRRHMSSDETRPGSRQAGGRHGQQPVPTSIWNSCCGADRVPQRRLGYGGTVPLRIAEAVYGSVGREQPVPAVVRRRRHGDDVDAGMFAEGGAVGFGVAEPVHEAIGRHQPVALAVRRGGHRHDLGDGEAFRRQSHTNRRHRIGRRRRPKPQASSHRRRVWQPWPRCSTRGCLPNAEPWN